MKKILILLAAFIVVAVIGVVLTSHLILAGILSSAIGAPVKVGRVSLGLSGAGIYGLEIGNPKGFNEKRLASIPEASVTYDLGALFKGKVHLKQIRIDMQEVTVERNSEGKFNLMEIKALKKPAQPPVQESKKPEPGQESSKPQPSKPAKLPPLQIDEVSLDLGKARFASNGTVKEFDLGVKNESFHNVTYAPALIRDMVFFILKKVGMSAFPANLDSLLQGVGGEVGTTVNKWMNKLNNF